MIAEPALKDITSTNQNADQELSSSETIVLSGQDAVNFLDLLENSPEPRVQLKQSAQKFRENFRNQVSNSL